MRLRCSHCYESKYSQFTSISYRWDLADYREATATFNAWEDGKCTKVPVPIVRNGQVKTIMNTDLFFFDKANARSDGGQWEPENVAKTYGSGGKMLCLLNNKDRRIIDYNREDSIHQAPRDRGSYTDSPYGKQERAFGYSHLDSSKVRFIGPDGRDLGNIEVTGLIKEDRNIYGKLAASGNILPGCNNPRQAMEKITEITNSQSIKLGSTSGKYTSAFHVHISHFYAHASNASTSIGHYVISHDGTKKN
ncbi:uncharacterized protein BHQ10_003255 [Talaromyces amestolkiae]|uniref:Uncharacterized protein n=1 Tax=Talaromyces amestolkiae TaxID=1196081 RepID=A0A364KUM9_TALAM|nr:uncharacterized protein BHQ10_003255 [Talaromyces amestolkiae]RAO67243.1 hypothetical protein BHQ10_003255 [Talaromyces amestolkiae]